MRLKSFTRACAGSLWLGLLALGCGIEAVAATRPCGDVSAHHSDRASRRCDLFDLGSHDWQHGQHPKKAPPNGTGVIEGSVPLAEVGGGHGWQSVWDKLCGRPLQLGHRVQVDACPGAAVNPT